LVEDKFLHALAIENNVAIAFHEISFNNTIKPSEIGQIQQTLQINGSENTAQFAYLSTQNTLVPTLLYNETIKDSYVQELYGNLHDKKIETNSSKDTLIQIVSRIDKNLWKAIPTNKTINNWLQFFIEYLQQQIKQEFIHICFLDKAFAIGASAIGQLQYAHIHPYQVPAEVTYTIIQFLNQSNWQKENTTIEISGMIQSNSPLYTELQKFFPKLQWVEESYYTQLNANSSEKTFHQLFPNLLMKL
jgi:hypothetical protein